MIERIPSGVLAGVMTLLGLPSESSIHEFSFAGGGCINSGGRLKSVKGDFFVKWNDANRYPGMFEAESRGLNMLAGENSIRLPQVVGNGEKENYQFLVLEYINQKQRSDKYWQQLGHGLAALHDATNKYFGLDHDNFIGSLKQYNKRNSSWLNFFIEERLNVQLALCVENGMARVNWVKNFESLYSKLPSLLPEAKPSLLHGDLWSGNLITDEKGKPCLIDPAVYFGNREVDLAMTKLFGGFAAEFYKVYEAESGIQKNYEDRLDLYNLYPLLVHVNLFGGSYVQSVDEILRRFA
jgi:protein-ribulosamine 3-kinase